MERLISFLGIFVFIGLAYAMSYNRRAIQWKVVVSGLLLQFVFAFIVLWTEPGKQIFLKFGSLVSQLLEFSQAGTRFVFGNLADPGGVWGFVFAVKVLTTIIFFASLMNVLYYLGIMQKIISVIARFMVVVLGTSGAETLCGSANIFMGQTESPLFIKPYLERLTRSELMVVMVTGFATIAAGVMFIYSGMLSPYFPAAAGHLLAASMMSAPAAIVMAKILLPETEEPETRGSLKVELPVTESNLIEAAANGASTGLSLALNVGAMLIAFIALIAMVNGAISGVCGLFGRADINLEFILGYLFAPFAFLMGVPSGPDILKVGQMLGKNLVLNEFVAYTDLLGFLKQGTIDGRSAMITVYALCGFSNLSSIGIQIGGIGALAPGRKTDLAKLGMVAVLGATLANFQTAAIAGVVADQKMMMVQAETAPPSTIPPAPTATPVATPATTTTETPAPDISDD